MNWTLEFDGEEKTIADWGLSNLHRRRVSQDRDIATFISDGRAMDAPNLFTPFEDSIIIRRDRVRNSGGIWSGGATWFAGIVIEVPRRGASSGESHSYKVAGPWWYLDTLVFEKTFSIFDHWTIADDPSSLPVYNHLYFSHCFLNLASPLAETPLGKMTSGQQIIEALEWALKQFDDAGEDPPFQIGDVTPAVDMPFDEVRDITCAEVIHKMLRVSPDAVTWFDYTTTPPTFHCKRRSGLTPIALDLVAGNLIRELNINPRYDLQSDYVLIRYEQTQSVNGVSWMIPILDQWPDPKPAGALANFNALRYTVDLQGAQTSSTTARLAVENITPDQAEWWLKRHPQFETDAADSNNPVQEVEIIGGSVRREPVIDGQIDAGYTRELSTGQLTDWMNFLSQRITISAKANIRHRNGHYVKEHPVTYQCLSTNATAGTYRTESVSAYAEPVPVGLARAIYDAISILHYDGSLVLNEQDISGQVTIGNLLNLTGGQLSEWASMDALVQEIEEDVDAGTTTISFGPPRDLSANELVELLRINRNRLVHYSPNLMNTGAGGAGAGEVSLGHNTPEKNSSSTPGVIQRSVISNGINGDGPIVISDASDPLNLFTRWMTGPYDPTKPAPVGSITIALKDAEGHTMNIRKIGVCQNSVEGFIYILASEFVPNPTA